MTTLHRLELFAAVAKYQSLTKAAEANFISQPGISTQLKLLEQDYGVKLYRRTSQGVVLTPEGTSLFGEVQAILSRIEGLGKTLRRVKRNARVESLTVGGTLSTCSLFLPNILAQFKRFEPKASVALRTNSNAQIEKMVLHSLVDIALTTRAPASAQLVAERFQHGRFVAFAVPDFRLPRKRHLAPGDLAKIPLVIRNVSTEGRTRDFLKWCERQGMELNIAMRCESPDAVKTAVKAGIGVGILFEDFVKSDVRKGSLKIVGLDGLSLDSSSFVIYRKDRPLSPVARRFRGILRDHLRRQVPSGAAGRRRKDFFRSSKARNRNFSDLTSQSTADWDGRSVPPFAKTETPTI